MFIKSALCAEFNVNGVIDTRATHADTIKSYLSAGYGKFSSDNKNALSLAQLGTELTIDWDSGISTRFVINGYSDHNGDKIGLTEGYIKYKSLPNSQGYRWQIKAGIFYPDISLENRAYAWASSNTLNSSTINTWIGEELRILGTEFELSRLGKFHDSNFDISVAASVFVNNDPAGALLSWHGWTVGNRQTLWTESIKIPPFSANMPGGAIAEQAQSSDPFLELDDRAGFHVQGKLSFIKKGIFSLGYYDNQAKPYVTSHGQYGWRTRFMHAGVSWRIENQLSLNAQYLTGDTLMQNSIREDLVNNKYSSAYVSLSKKIKRHRLTFRIEEFSITDTDQTLGDDNNEYGKSSTMSYSYRYSKPWVLSVEYNWINSSRPSRLYENQSKHLIEKQLQLAARYFF